MLERQGNLAVLEGSQHKDTGGGKTSVPFKGSSRDVKKRAKRRLQRMKMEDTLLTEACDINKKVVTDASTLLFEIAESELMQA